MLRCGSHIVQEHLLSPYIPLHIVGTFIGRRSESRTLLLRIAAQDLRTYPAEETKMFFHVNESPGAFILGIGQVERGWAASGTFRQVFHKFAFTEYRGLVRDGKSSHSAQAQAKSEMTI
jgi:hypothetical protein